MDGGTWGGFGRPNEKSGRVYVRQGETCCQHGEICKAQPLHSSDVDCCFLACLAEENPGRLHFALLAPSAEAVKQYWQAATAAGGKDNGAPGPRSHVGSDGKGVGCFVIDLDDNNIEVLYHGE